MAGRVLPLFVSGALFFQAVTASGQDKCFTRLDNGVDMTGWHKSDTNHHGPGLGWSVEGGAFVGRQTGANLGGILMTDKTYKDVEVVFEVKIDWGCDSGFFFRTTAGDRAYQVNVDHLQDAGVGTIYGEGFAQELRYRPYYLTDMGNTALKDPVLTPIFDLSKWSTIWHPTDFNEIRARVEGNPPHLQVWIAGTKVMDFTDAMQRAEIDATGPLAIQVHGGAARWIANGAVQFRNIRVNDLTVPCVDNGAGGGGGTGGSGGASGSGVGGASGGAGGAVTSGGASGAGGALASAGQNTSGGMPTTAGGGGAAGNESVPISNIPNEGISGSSSAASSAASSGDSSGCGCRTAPARDASGALSLLLLFGLIKRLLPGSRSRRAARRRDVG